MKLRKTLTFFIILLAFVSETNAKNIILSENFDYTEIGSIPKEWKLAQIGPKDLVYVQDNYVISDERTLYIKESGKDTTNIKLLSKKFSVLADFEYSFKFRIVGFLQARAVFNLMNSAEELCMAINCRTSDNWRYTTEGKTWHDIPNIPTPISGQVYDVKIIGDSENDLVNVIVNDIESDWLQANKNLDEIAQFSFSTNYNFPSEFWIDDILILDTYVPIENKGSITIKKKVDWGSKTQYEDDTSFKFQSSWDDEISLKNGEHIKSSVKPGIYEISEVLLNGWDLNEIKIEDPSGDSYVQDMNSVIIDIEENEQVTITFVNRPPTFVIPETPFGTLGIILVTIFVLIFKSREISN